MVKLIVAVGLYENIGDRFFVPFTKHWNIWKNE